MICCSFHATGFALAGLCGKTKPVSANKHCSTSMRCYIDATLADDIQQPMQVELNVVL